MTFFYLHSAHFNVMFSRSEAFITQRAINTNSPAIHVRHAMIKRKWVLRRRMRVRWQLKPLGSLIYFVFSEFIDKDLHRSSCSRLNRWEEQMKRRPLAYAAVFVVSGFPIVWAKEVRWEQWLYTLAKTGPCSECKKLARSPCVRSVRQAKRLRRIVFPCRNFIIELKDIGGEKVNKTETRSF